MGDQYLPIHPQTLGEDIEVPFINCFLRKVQLGTDVTAPPGAVTVTPRPPSALHIEKHLALTIYSS